MLDVQRQRAIEFVRGHFAKMTYFKQHKRLKKIPASVEMFSIDEHSDLFGASDKALYHRHSSGRLTRIPYDYEASMALYLLRRFANAKE